MVVERLFSPSTDMPDPSPPPVARPRRRRRSIARWTICSLGVALLIFALFAWWRSDRIGDRFTQVVRVDGAATTAETSWIIESHRGRALFTRAQRFYGMHPPGHRDLNGALVGWHHRTLTLGEAWWQLSVPRYRNRWEVPGLALAAPPAGDAAGALRVIVIGFAWWFPAGCSAAITLLCLLPTATAWRRRRRRRRRERKRERCPGCGYDLRASPTRCPECGLDRATAMASGDG
jgi:hypothetical protein